MEKVTNTNDAPCFLHKHGFDFDLFFSYSHGDPRGKGDTPLKRWSKQFCQALGDNLDAVLAPPPRIFFDESADGVNKTAHLLPELLKKVRSSALFHIVMSPHYLKSDWCLRELATFLERFSDQAEGVSDRVFIAKAMETARQAWPAALCDEEGNKTVGWEFHERGQPYPHGWQKKWDGDAPPEIGPELQAIANRIAQALVELDAQLTEKTSKEKSHDNFVIGAVERIYVYGRTDEAAAWEATSQDIRTLGIDVLPIEPEPVDAYEDAEKRLDYAKLGSLCDAMLMVGGNGVKLDYDLDVIGRERRNFIASRYRKYLPCAVIDRGGGLNHPARIGNAKRFDIDWIEAGSGKWPDDVRTWLQTSAAEKVRQRYGLAERPT